MIVLLNVNQNSLNMPRPLDKNRLHPSFEYILETPEGREIRDPAVDLDGVLESNKTSHNKNLSRYHALHVPKYPIYRLSQFIKQKVQSSPRLSHRTSETSLTSIASFSLSDDESGQLEDGESIFLDLSFKGLEKFPETQHDITHLVLANNDINWFPLCTFWNLPHLVMLDLSFNQVTELPPDIGQVLTLRELYLKNNHIEILPHTIYNLENLEVLDISDNRIRCIDPSICRLTSLTHLDIRNNQLVDIPFSLGLLSANLASFLVDGNPFIYPFSDLVVPILSAPFRGRRSFIKVSNTYRDKSALANKKGDDLAGYGYGDAPMYKKFSLGRLTLNRKPAVVTLLDNEGTMRKERKISPPLNHLRSKIAQHYPSSSDTTLNTELDMKRSSAQTRLSKTTMETNPKLYPFNPHQIDGGADLNPGLKVSAEKLFIQGRDTTKSCENLTKGQQLKTFFDRTLRPRFSSPNLIQNRKNALLEMDNGYPDSRRNSIDQNRPLWNLNNSTGFDLLSSSYSSYSGSFFHFRPGSWSSGDLSSTVSPGALSTFLSKLRDLYDLDPETNEHDLLKVGIQKCGDGVTSNAGDPDTEQIYRKAVHLSMYGIVDQRHNIINEIISTEETYVTSLENLVQIYLLPAEANKVMSLKKSKAIFSNVESILLFHRDHLLPALRACMKEEGQCIGRVFAKHNPYIKMYSVYINNFEYALSELQSLLAKHPKRTGAYLKSALKNPNHNQLNLQGYLLLPVQRIPRYKMLLQDLLANTLPDHPDREDLQLALEQMSTRAQEINERKREHERKHRVISIQARIKGASDIPLVQPQRRYIHEGVLHLYKIVRTFNAQVKDPKTQKTRDCPYLHEMVIDSDFMFYLFNDIMIKCKPSSKEHRKLRILQLSSRSKPATMIQPNMMRLVDNQTILYFTGSSELLKQWTELINHRADA
ncbi:hypothetical protein K493DRAFT_28902 [Basidiobolus meristosporus CBS 931.73]|uniref:DH domain-containing protein n=1 Tax=Basidiobolus meristosporus CBS 931.73 TaxID=1314790 RepID=A0A1Y1ZD86_9FUNG|nr:hypothetical protein K493DRAFT_28902 [Basidiobolus meristosporus CBS 931.73]|eukprot:ORY08250.1 hypothetical protein K493DRAFT_28902 [Basidiobolus meristosporus CBS 931.73]